MNTTTLIQNVVREAEATMALYQQSEGEELELHDLSEEEDADYIKDNEFNMKLAFVSNPIAMAMS